MTLQSEQEFVRSNIFSKQPADRLGNDEQTNKSQLCDPFYRENRPSVVARAKFSFSLATSKRVRCRINWSLRLCVTSPFSFATLLQPEIKFAEIQLTNHINVATTFISLAREQLFVCTADLG
jgi:hypothetical protein